MARTGADLDLSAGSARDLPLYLCGMFFGTLAIQIQSVVVSWQIYGIRHDPMALGYVGLAQFLPIVAWSLPAGHFADRLDRRKIIVVSYFVQAVTSGFFLALALAKTATVWPFYAVLVLFGTARTFAGPAGQSFLPLLVARDRFPQAVAWNSSIFQTAVIVGPAVGGVIYILGPAVAYGVCLSLLLVVAFTMTALSTRSEVRTGEVGVTVIERLTAGIAYVRSKPMILGAISLDLFAVLLGGATALLPIFARDILHVGSAGLGLLRSAPALGAALCGVFLGHIPLRHAGLTMFACVTMFGVATIIFGLSENFILSLAALTLLGASDMVSVYVRSTMIQLGTPDAMRGRVSAVNRLFIGASNELGEFESGLTATWFGTVPSVVIGGIGTLAVVAIWMWFFPALREVDRLADVTPG